MFSAFQHLPALPAMRALPSSPAWPPFSFSFGQHNFIKWCHPVVFGIKVGCKRLLVLPFPLAYGVRGREPAIPPKATLLFEIELLKIEKK